jgi:hypothetical protein
MGLLANVKSEMGIRERLWKQARRAEDEGAFDVKKCQKWTAGRDAQVSDLRKRRGFLLYIPIGTQPENYENVTSFGSRGSPSVPMLFFLKPCSMNTLLASSKLMPRVFMSRCTSRFPL